MISVRELAAALGLTLVPFAFIYPVRISGRSMEPLLKEGEVHLALRAWCAGPPHAGQIWLAGRLSETVVKRLAAGPGSRVEIRDGELWINGRFVPEPYVATTERASGGPWETSQGWFLLGDNRSESYDSRAWGPLPVEGLKARILR